MSELFNQTVKTTIGDDDRVAVGIPSQVGADNVKWSVIKSLLKTYFDTLYSTVTSFLGLSDTPSDYSGQAGKTLLVKSTEDGLEFGDAGGGSGGHTISQDDVDFTARTNLNFVTNNGEDIVLDDAANDQTDITLKIRAASDYDATGEQAASVIQRNAADDGYEAGQTAYDDKNLLTPYPSVTADGQLTGAYVLAGYKFQVIAVNETANAITGFKLTDGTNDLFTAGDIAASGFTAFEMDLTKFDPVNDLDLYAAATTWNSGDLTLYFRFERLI